MQIAAGQFKVQCLKLIEQVQQTKKEIIITKQGTPVARLVPIEAASRRESIIGWMNGSIAINGDIISPSSAIWEADFFVNTPERLSVSKLPNQNLLRNYSMMSINCA